MDPGPEPPLRAGAATCRVVALGVAGTLLTLLGLVVVALVPAALSLARDRADRTACADRLRRLASAAIQYADDKRFFPKIAPHRVLDGGIEAADTPRKVRALLWYGYQDDPRTWVCPASDDEPEPAATPARLDPRAWRWGGAVGSPTGASGPIVEPDGDPSLLATHELSFGWQRRGLTSGGAMSGDTIAADRAVRGDDAGPGEGLPGSAGNHAGGWNVVTVASGVQWIPADAALTEPYSPEHLRRLASLSVRAPGPVGRGGAPPPHPRPRVARGPGRPGAPGGGGPAAEPEPLRLRHDPAARPRWGLVLAALGPLLGAWLVVAAALCGGRAGPPG